MFSFDLGPRVGKPLRSSSECGGETQTPLNEEARRGLGFALNLS